VWADGDGDDDPGGPHSRTAYAYAALCGRLFTLLFPSQSDFGISLPGCRSESRPACAQPRAPPCRRELSEATSHLRLIVSDARSSDLLVSPRVFRLRACRHDARLSREGGETTYSKMIVVRTNTERLLSPPGFSASVNLVSIDHGKDPITAMEERRVRSAHSGRQDRDDHEQT
jgi:hypothetical protein